MNRLTPGIRAEATLILADDGHVGIYLSKLLPEDNPSQIYGDMLNRFLQVLSTVGVTLSFKTPDGQEFPLVRPHGEAVREGPQHLANSQRGPTRFCGMCKQDRVTYYQHGILLCTSCHYSIDQFTEKQGMSETTEDYDCYGPIYTTKRHRRRMDGAIVHDAEGSASECPACKAT